jgi:putative Mg2+ transporter-C (MgtC) family protein
MEFDFRAELPLLLRLVLAGALAAMLGWEREAARKPAGLRTHMLVGIASALFTVLSALAVGDYSGAPGDLRSDPVRVIQAVAIGIGFLGSGVIFVDKNREQVQGLTTAASIWATAAIGIAAGLGHFVVAVGSAVILLIVLRVMARFERNDR